MAGPTISVLLRFEPDQSTEELVQAYLAQRADHLRPGCRTFSVGGCALLYAFGPHYPEELAHYAGLLKLLDWNPRGILNLAAMGNDLPDHQRLGEVALDMTRRLDGVVAFGGRIGAYTADAVFLSRLAVLEHEGESLFSAGDFERWLQHADFRLVK